MYLILTYILCINIFWGIRLWGPWWAVRLAVWSSWNISFSRVLELGDMLLILSFISLDIALHVREELQCFRMHSSDMLCLEADIQTSKIRQQDKIELPMQRGSSFLLFFFFRKTQSTRLIHWTRWLKVFCQAFPHQPLSPSNCLGWLHMVFQCLRIFRHFILVDLVVDQGIPTQHSKKPLELVPWSSLQRFTELLYTPSSCLAAFDWAIKPSTLCSFWMAWKSFPIEDPLTRWGRSKPDLWVDEANADWMWESSIRRLVLHWHVLFWLRALAQSPTLGTGPCCGLERLFFSRNLTKLN